MEDAQIIEYIKSNFPEELRLIERSLINYYSLRSKKNKSLEENDLMESIFLGVLKLFAAISSHIAEEYGLDKGELKIQIINIFVKT